MLSGSKSTVWLRVSPIAAARKSIAACAVGLAGVAAASAADIPLAAKATPPIIAPASWAGFYLGVHGGYGWGENNFREYLVDTSPFPFFDGVRSRGAVVGGHAGYNWQYGRAVTGLEIDWSA